MFVSGTGWNLVDKNLTCVVNGVCAKTAEDDEIVVACTIACIIIIIIIIIVRQD